jgi:hypothetical protein
MSIKFVCTCGKHLRARDEMAGRRSVCPRCGNPVGIPLLHPTHPGANLGPMTRAERLRTRRVVPCLQDALTEAPAASAAGPAITQPLVEVPAEPEVKERTRRRRVPLPTSQVRLVRNAGQGTRRLEQHWYQCLLYPARDVALLGVALGLTVLTGITIRLLPAVMKLQAELAYGTAPFFLFFGLALLLVLGYASGLLESAFLSALAGRSYGFSWSMARIDLAFRRGARWLVCFLAGPALFVGASVVYWLRCGDPGFLDWVILAELNLLAAGVWLFMLVAMSLSDRLIDVPRRLAALLGSQAKHVMPVLLLAAVVLLGHGLWGVFAINDIHLRPKIGWQMLTVCWVSGLFWETFLFRLVGVRCHWARL